MIHIWGGGESRKDKKSSQKESNFVCSLEEILYNYNIGHEPLAHNISVIKAFVRAYLCKNVD
jgi:hypothetical protein